VGACLFVSLAYPLPYSRASFFASLGMVIGIVTKNVETSSVVGQVITFPMMFLSGTFFPISYMPTDDVKQIFIHEYKTNYSEEQDMC